MNRHNRFDDSERYDRNYNYSSIGIETIDARYRVYMERASEQLKHAIMDLIASRKA